MKITFEQRLLLLSIIFYASSLFFNGYNGFKNEHEGYHLVLFGWLNLLHGGANIAWLANPAIWISWFLKNIKTSMFFSLFATISSLFFLLFDSVPNAHLCGSGFLDSYWCDETIQEINLGYYLWTISSILMLIRGFKSTKVHVTIYRFIRTKKLNYFNHNK